MKKSIGGKRSVINGGEENSKKNVGSRSGGAANHAWLGGIEEEKPVGVNATGQWRRASATEMRGGVAKAWQKKIV